MTATVALMTLGCKVNQYEGQSLAADLTAGGFTLVDFKSPAHAYIINACTVTAESDHKCRQLVYRARRQNPDALVVITGCFSPSAAETLAELGVDLLVDNATKTQLPRLLSAKLDGNVRSLKTVGAGGRRAPTRTRAYLKIQDGCDDFCSYCIVPYVRGPLRSRPAAAVIDEARALLEQGVPEIVLTGIHLGKYGIDLKGAPNLAALVEQLLDRAPVARLRLSSIELAEVDDGLVGLMANSDRLANHLHVPLQSGSDRILAMMNRRYTAADFVKRIGLIRRRIPDLALTTDVIVGFPAESAADFAQTLDIVERCAFSRLHVFRYSPRAGTAAANLPDDVAPMTKKERAQQLRLVGARQAAAYAATHVGAVRSVLVESRQNGEGSGLTEHYLRVKFKQPAQRGRMLDVAITSTDGALLVGRALS